MIASLMMYERAQLAQAHQRLWSLIRCNLRAHGIACPERLSQHAEEFYVWTHPELVLSQTCGMPYRTWLHDKLQLVGTPDYELEGCLPGYYRSALVVRGNDSRTSLPEFAQSTFAYNQPFSQSGYAAAYWHTRAAGFWFTRKYHSGAHNQSARAVADGRADIAALDAVSWRFMQRYDNAAKRLRVLDWTLPTPGLPLITSSAHNKALIRDAVSTALSELTGSDRALLGIKQLAPITKAEYLAVSNPDLVECRTLAQSTFSKV